MKLDYSTNGGSTYSNAIVAQTDASTGTYSWTIPDAIGTQLRVKASDAANATVTDSSNADFTIKGSLSLTAPNGSEVWYVGESRNVTWTKTGTIANVKLEYSANGGNTYPNVEVVLLNCVLDGISPAGWGDVGGDTSQAHYWEYNSTNLRDGTPADVSARHPVSKRLKKDEDAQTIANYSNPTWVLGGWTPATLAAK